MRVRDDTQASVQQAAQAKNAAVKTMDALNPAELSDLTVAGWCETMY